jgi:hypothetical protein
MTAKRLDASKLAKLAKVASDAVRQEAVISGHLLPIWRNGEVMYESASTGAIVPSKPSAQDGKKIRASLKKAGPIKIRVLSKLSSG